ncbi:hypothetical protein C0U40_16720 [Amylibacter cionae]|nr:hypothetical protein C0U40_16720 [Amylibacter cionae]
MGGEIRWAWQPGFGSNGWIDIGPTFGTAPLFRFSGDTLAPHTDGSFSGVATGFILYFPASPFRALEVTDIELDLGALFDQEFETAPPMDFTSQEFVDLINDLEPFSVNVFGSGEKDVLQLHGAGSVAKGKGGADVFIVPHKSFFQDSPGGTLKIVGGGGKDAVTFEELYRPLLIGPDGPADGDPVFTLGRRTFETDLKSVEKLFGTTMDDEIQSTGSLRKIYGHDGADSLYGGLGEDSFYGGSGGDSLFGGGNNDRLFGGGGGDYIYGGPGEDSLFGGGGGDSLYSGGGGGLLNSGGGRDLLYGGSGNETFVTKSGRDEVRTGGGKDEVQFSKKHNKLFVEEGSEVTVKNWHGSNSLFIFSDVGMPEMEFDVSDGNTTLWFKEDVSETPVVLLEDFVITDIDSLDITFYDIPI